jgi:hypothetical protein
MKEVKRRPQGKVVPEAWRTLSATTID